MVEYLNLLGYPRIVLKSDQEPSLVSFKMALREQWKGGECSLEESPVQDPESNGLVERAVRSLKEVIRTLLSDLKAKTQWKLQNSKKEDANTLCWLIEHAGTLLRPEPFHQGLE